MPELREEIAALRRQHAEPDQLLAAVDQLLERGEVDPARASFERAALRDGFGMERAAIGLYQQALDGGLVGERRVQCLVQLASSLRNEGQAQRALQVLDEARTQAVGEQGDWVAAFHALTLHSAGQQAAALRTALEALSAHLSRYGPAVRAYAAELPRPPQAGSATDNHREQNH